MNILKNVSSNQSPKAANSILFAVASVAFVSLLLIFPKTREFVCSHPGLIGVLIAVSGEVYFDWGDAVGKHAKVKRFFMALLVVSLAYELYEASDADQKAADAIKAAGIANNLAAQANERAGRIESTNLDLQKGVADANKQLESEKIERLKLLAQIEANDPQKQPITSVELISARLGIEGEDMDDESRTDGEVVVGHVGWRSNPNFTNSVPIEVRGVVTRVSERGPSSTNRVYFLDETPDRGGKYMLMFHSGLTAENINGIAISVPTKFGPVNILNGRVTILINGIIRKTFEILPHRGGWGPTATSMFTNGTFVPIQWKLPSPL